MTYTSPEGMEHVYTYRKNDQLNTVTIDGRSFTFTYDKNRLSELTFPNGVVTDYAYNANSWLTGIATSGPNGVISNRDYTHDHVGNIQSKNTEHGLYDYDYDKTYQLISADNPTLEDEAYSYDKVGNRLTSLMTASLWSYNLNNELISDTRATYEYDANGNTTKKIEGGQTTIYEYNARNRLSKVYLPDGRVADYAYDPFGRRIRKQVANAVTWFVYADEGLIGEYGEQGVSQKAYGWRPGGLWGTDPLYMTEDSGFYCYHNDHLGTPQRLTDDAGVVVWSAGYQAFGLAVVDAASTVGNNLRFPGQYFDAETGLHYNWHRMYDPVAGRYTQVDPIGFAGGDVNVYRYVGGNPLSFIDPLGLMQITICRDTGELTVYDDNDEPIFEADVITGCPDNATRPGKYQGRKWQENKKNSEYPTPWNEDNWANPYGPWFMPLYKDGKYSTYGIHGTKGPGWNPLVKPPLSEYWSDEDDYYYCSHGCTRLSNPKIRKLHDLIPNPNNIDVIIKDCKK